VGSVPLMCDGNPELWFEAAPHAAGVNSHLSDTNDTTSPVLPPFGPEPTNHRVRGRWLLVSATRALTKDGRMCQPRKNWTIGAIAVADLVMSLSAAPLGQDQRRQFENQ